MRKRVWISTGVIIILLVLTSAGVLFLVKTDHESTARVQEPLRRVPVEVHELVERPFTRTVEAYATITPFRKGTVSAQVSGPIAKLATQTEPGMYVKGSQELARIEDIRYRLAIQKAKASVDKLRALLEIEENENQRRTALFRIAKQRLTLAQSDYDRKRELFEKDLIAAQTLELSESQLELQRSEYERARSDLQSRQARIKSIQADIASAKAELRRLNEDLADTVVRAPFEGIIGDRFVELGDRVAPGEKLFTVLDISSVKVKARIPSEHIDRIQLGDVVDVTTRTYPAAVFKGTVIHVYPEADPQTRTFAAEIQVINLADRMILPGMFARVRLPIMTLERAIAIPRDAILEDALGTYIYVVEPSTQMARRKKVRLGYIGPEVALVSQGVESGDLLVIRGQERLHDGALVMLSGSTPSGSASGDSAVPSK